MRADKSNPYRNMNSLIRGSLVFFSLCVGTALAAETVKVASSRELRLAIVDPAKPSAAREATHAAFAASLRAAVTKQCGGEVGVRMKCVPADNAAFNLGTGVYDAVLVLGGSLPRALMTSDVSRLSATLGAGKTEKKVYLIFGNEDATLAGLLSNTFDTALTDGRFLDAVDGIDGKIARSGSKLAASP